MKLKKVLIAVLALAMVLTMGQGLVFAEDGSDGESADSSSGEADAANEAAVEGGEAIAMKANDYLWSPQYTTFSPDRFRSEMELVIPVPYDTWSFDEPNYGPTKEEWESYNVDLDAWYAAHAS